jgi:hypothetical protein
MYNPVFVFQRSFSYFFGVIKLNDGKIYQKYIFSPPIVETIYEEKIILKADYLGIKFNVFLF